MSTSPLRFRTFTVAFAMLLGALTPALEASAEEEYCVDTSAEIINAIRAADDDDVIIRVEQGTYNLTSNPMSGTDDPSLGYNVTIIGGYTSGCGSRSLDPSLTTFNSSASRFEISSYDSISIDSIRFRNFESGIYFEAMSYGGSGPDEVITLRRVIFDNLCTSGQCSPDSSNFPSVYLNSDEISLSHVIAAHNAHSSCTMEIDTYDLDDAYLSYSVFADNDGDGLCMTRSNGDEDFRLHAENNIFWDNAGGQDIRTRISPYISLRNNIYHVLDASPAPDTSPIATINQDPQFTAPASSNYHLQTGSPAINSGTIVVSNPLTQDIDGGPRQAGSAPDRGAYETNVDDTNIVMVTTAADQVAPLITGSLRWAIIHANGDPGLNYIRFNIPGSCPRMITLAAPLPTITDRVIIQGYTQPGSEPNTAATTFNATICIGIRGDLSDDYGFRIPSSVGASHSLQLSGVAIGGFDIAAVDLQGGAGSWIHGVQFAGELGSGAIGNSAVNVRISGDSYYNLIGGDDKADRNLIPFAYQVGVQIINGASATGHKNYVYNNLIGTSRGGGSIAPNALGIQISGRDNEIRDNVISGNSTYGIALQGVSAHDNKITDNRIGLKPGSLSMCFPPPCDNDEDLGNGSAGIVTLNDASDNWIANNRIAYNVGSGIRFADGQHNTLLSNITYENGGLGIDLNSSGADPVDNDAAPGAATQANRGINYPALSLVRGGVHRGLMRSVLASINGTYIVQLYSDTTCDASGHGEGHVYHSSSLITIDNASSGSNGTVVFDMPINWSGTLTGRAFSMTVRDTQGNSSEYSDCAVYTCDTIFGYGTDSGAAEVCSAN